MTAPRWKPIRAHLLPWFDRHQRDLPWRRTQDPYAVWVSEIMLQQTQVATVIPYYERFLQRFPNPSSLAAAPQQEVLRLWEGLGYYRRAKSLHAAAQVIVEQHEGEFPRAYDDVLALPGIGRYTAGAILSIACGQPLPILEGNTIRVHSRLAGITDDVKASATQKKLWQLATAAVDPQRPGDFNQALMELGSELCTPRQPRCDECPVRVYCEAKRTNRVQEIPFTAQKMAFESRQEAVLLVARGPKVLMRQCQDGERWAGLWDFPRFETQAASSQEELSDRLAEACGLVADFHDTGWQTKHGVTRFRISLACYRAENVRGRLSRSAHAYRWVPRDELSELPLSVTGRQVAEKLNRLLA